MLAGWGRRKWAAAQVVLALALHATVACAARLELDLDIEGDPGDGALVLSLHSPAAAAQVAPVQAVMDQRGRQFAPTLLVVPVGSTVAFPNSDDIRHHVYSFSAARRFELPLYAGGNAEPVEFPEAGVVVLGCNIHDWMQAHILVMDTPHHREVDPGVPTEHWIEAPPGDYVLRVWHARLAGDAPWIEQTVRLDDAEVLRLPLALTLTPPQGPVLSEDAQLRALQERFRALRKDP